jgi:outer membrane murein-binding lipoprotein Lpp
MPGPVAAIAGAAVVGAGASIIGGRSQAKAVKDASKAQTKAQKQALEAQMELARPYVEAGKNAMTQYQNLAPYQSFSMDQFQADPGYQFRMSEGLKALERSASARGLLQSGGTLKDITRFGQDAASQEYQNAFQRYLTERETRMDPYRYLTGIGQAAAAGQAANVGEGMTALGNIQSAGIMGQSNAFTNTLGDISSLATGAANAYGQYQAGLPYQNYLNALASTGSSSGLGVAPPPGYAMPRI